MQIELRGGRRRSATSSGAVTKRHRTSPVFLTSRMDLHQPDSWELSDHIVSPTPQNNGWFGLSSSIGGDYVLVGEPLGTQDGADQAGGVYAFERGAGYNWDADPPEQSWPTQPIPGTGLVSRWRSREPRAHRCGVQERQR